MSTQIKSTFLIVALALATTNYLRKAPNPLNQYAPVLQLTTGPVRGLVQKTETNETVYFYQGIRYGQASRFALPQAATPWTDVYEATHYREACPQLPSGRIFGRMMSRINKTDQMSEDCLYLNVWRPAEESPKPRAVMVWIHGGAFETGTIFTEAYDGRYLAHQGDVIVVSINYRLGALGFLSGGEVPGNLGLHDQILALKWVQSNIRAFGGDPKQVTIFGESAGGISVGALVLSPLTRGLFTRAILQSGAQSGFYTSESKTQSLEKTLHLAGKLDCPTDPTQLHLTISCLRSKTVPEILTASKDAFVTNKLFLPVYGDTLLPLRPQEALKAGTFNQNLDLMVGVTADEGSMFALAIFPELHSNETILTVDSTKERIIKMMVHYSQSYGAEVADFYVDKLVNPSQDDLRSAIGHVWGDYHLVCPTILFSEYYAKHSPDSHFFTYNLVQPIILSKSSSLPSWMGVFHATDIFYLFMAPRLASSPLHYQLSQDMMLAWSSFAKTGTPGTINGALLWEDSFDSQRKQLQSQVLILDPTNYRIETDTFKEKCDIFWKEKIFA